MSDWFDRQFDRDEEELEYRYREGEISAEEYREQHRRIQREYNDACADAEYADRRFELDMEYGR